MIRCLFFIYSLPFTPLSGRKSRSTDQTEMKSGERLRHETSLIKLSGSVIEQSKSDSLDKTHYLIYLKLFVKLKYEIKYDFCWNTI